MSADMLTVTIPGSAYREAWPVLRDASERGAWGYDWRVGSDAFTAFDGAEMLQRGRGVSYRVTCSESCMVAIRVKVRHVWQMSGGNGNPYGVDSARHSTTRRAAKVALDRIAVALGGQS